LGFCYPSAKADGNAKQSKAKQSKARQGKQAPHLHALPDLSFGSSALACCLIEGCCYPLWASKCGTSKAPLSPLPSASADGERVQKKIGALAPPSRPIFGAEAPLFWAFVIRQLKLTAMQCKAKQGKARQASLALTCFAGFKLWFFRTGLLLDRGLLLSFLSK